MKRKLFVLGFVFMIVFVGAGSLWAAHTSSTNFNLIFEKSPVALIDFVDPNDNSVTIDSINFPLVTSTNSTETVQAFATIRFQLNTNSRLVLVCTTDQSIDGYLATLSGGAQQERGMLVSEEGNRLNYSVTPTGIRDATLNQEYAAPNWKLDPSGWSNGVEMDDDDANWQTATVNTEYRMVTVYDQSFYSFTNDQLIYHGAYTDDLFIDLTFEITPPDGRIVDGVYTGYCHLVVETT